MSDDENLLDFLYALPIGFVEFAANGSVRRANPMIVRTLLPHVGTDAFTDAFALLQPLIPDLREALRHPSGEAKLASGRQRLRTPDEDLVLQADVHRVYDHFVAIVTDISDGAEAQRRINSILSTTGAATWEWNAQTGETRFDERWASMLGYTLGELRPLSVDTLTSLIHPDDRLIPESAIRAHFASEISSYDCDFRMRHKNESWVWINATGAIVSRTSDGEPEWVFGTHMDITRRVLQGQQLDQSMQKMQLIADAVNVGILTIGDGQVEMVSQHLQALYGYERADFTDLPAWIDRVAANGFSRVNLKLALGVAEYDEISAHGLPSNKEISLRTRNGAVKSVLLSSLRSAESFVVTMADISEQKHHEGLVAYRAQHDGLTGLPGKALMEERLEWTLKQARRSRWMAAVAFIDLDGFKEVNDGHGHDAGDAVLKVSAERMKEALRETDTVARIGGDEFVVILTELRSRQDCLPLFEMLQEKVRQPVAYGDSELRVSCSIGVSFFAQDRSMDGAQLMRQADKAMYDAKLAGKDTLRIFDREHDKSLRVLHHQRMDIASALQRGEFALFYQPQISLRSGAVVGAEALLRWRASEGVTRLPHEFLPTVLGHRLALELGAWVLGRALADLARLMDLRTDHNDDFVLGINVFPQQFLQDGFAEKLEEQLARYEQIQPSNVQLELVETAAISDLKNTKLALTACRAIGVSCALDDFGTGFSSLSHLKQLPVSTLKIDKSFVLNLTDSPSDLAVVRGTLSLAEAFGCNAVAEGIETAEQAQKLLEQGCNTGQGYVFARPMPLSDFIRWLDEWRSSPGWNPGLTAVGSADDSAEDSGARERGVVVPIDGDKKGYV